MDFFTVLQHVLAFIFFNMHIYSFFRITCIVFYLGVLQQENIVCALILLHTVNFQELDIDVWI